MVKILFISPHKSTKNSGWQDMQITSMGEKVVAFAHNDAITCGNIYNLNKFLIKVIGKFAPGLNVNIGYPYILEQIVKRHNCNVIICNFLDFALRFKKYIKSSALPFIIYCHGGDIIWDYKDANTGKPRYDESFFKQIDSIKDKAFFIANSSFTKKQLEKIGVDSSRIFIKYFGLDYSRPKKVQSFDEGLNVLYVGRLIGCKGPVETIKSFVAARKRGLKGRLTMVGKGPLWEECCAVASASDYSNDIILKGSLPYSEVQIEYERNDIVIAHHKKDDQTNQEETFGVSILEAFSLGLPVITGRSGGITDIINNGYNGFIIEAGDIDGQAQKLMELYENIELYNQMSANCIETVKAKFSKEQDEQRLNEILTTVLSRNIVVSDHYA